MKPFLHVIAALVAGGMSAFTALAESPADEARYLDQPMPDGWKYSAELTQMLPTDDMWWRQFDDPVLDSLIYIGVERNYDLRQASRRRELARIAVQQARSGYYPTIGVSAGYGRTRTPGALSGTHVKSTESNSFSLLADLSWEIDVFGRISAGVKAKKMAYHASQADYVAAMVSVCSQIAEYYVDLRVTQAQLAVAEEHLETQGKVLKIVEARHEAGLVSGLDVAQAKSLYYSTEATVPDLKASVCTYLNAIALLLGEYPSELYIGDYTDLPNSSHIVPAGVPADLLRRRPDIVAAEYTLAADAAELGVAKKEFLPTLSLTGSIGFESRKPGDLFRGNAFEWSVAPTLSWTIFEGFSRKYAVAEAREQMMADIDDYNLTVLTAVQEVDNAVTAYHAALETLEFVRKEFEQDELSFKLSIDQYKQGLSSFTPVADAEISWLTSANALVSARGNALIALVDLYKALGGAPIQP